jgi:hypothetical protein
MLWEEVLFQWEDGFLLWEGIFLATECPFQGKELHKMTTDRENFLNLHLDEAVEC